MEGKQKQVQVEVESGLLKSEEREGAKAGIRDSCPWRDALHLRVNCSRRRETGGSQLRQRSTEAHCQPTIVQSDNKNVFPWHFLDLVLPVVARCQQRYDYEWRAKVWGSLGYRGMSSVTGAHDNLPVQSQSPFSNKTSDSSQASDNTSTPTSPKASSELCTSMSFIRRYHYHAISHTNSLSCSHCPSYPNQTNSFLSPPSLPYRTQS